MADLSRMLEIGRSALNTYRYAMDVTSQNVANAQNPDYSRQNAIIETGMAIKSPYGYLGTGVVLKSIERMRDSFLDQEIRNTNFGIGSAQIQNNITSRLESYLNEPLDSGISTQLDLFFKSFQNLASNPEDPGVRKTVVQQGISLTKEFNYLAGGFDNARIDIIKEVQTRIKGINDLSTEIARLNKQIFSVSPLNMNELEDIRDKRLDELSKLINISTTKDENGFVNVSASGSTLVSGIDTFLIDMKQSGNNINIIYKDSGFSIGSLSGELGEEVEAFNNTIPKFYEMLDTFTNTLIAEVNNLHKAGFGLANPESGSASTGIDFFIGTNARNLKVNQLLQENTNLVAASSDGSEGNNKVALDIGDLLEKPILNDQTTSLLQYYRSFVTEIGFSVQDSSRLADALSTRVANLENLKLSVSGVSLDDEMVNLIKYQRSFDAASKIVNTVDEMFDTILNLKR